MKKKILVLAGALMAAWLLASPPALPAASEVIVIVNSEVPDGSLSAADLKAVYLGKKTFWSGGLKIALDVLSEGSVHEDFLKKSVGKTPEQFKNYWNQILYTGAGIPPTPFKTEKELVEHVQKTKGAIGYIDSATPHDGVKVLKVSE
jgi:ABC-type phosphate transport system substrate-binding protein